MTRKDYKVLATALGVAGKNMEDGTWEATLDIVARSLRRNYPNFDRVRFEAAANMTRTMPCIVIHDAITPEEI
jgi:hypothetical protein